MNDKSKNRPILLVEDNPMDEQMTLYALRESKLKNEIVVVRDGEEALEYLFGTGRYAGRSKRDVPQVVLLDLKLPKLDGLDVLRRVRADPEIGKLPIVVLTSSDEDADIVKSYHLGANSFVRKPVEHDAFLNAVIQLGLYWVVINELPV